MKQKTILLAFNLLLLIIFGCSNSKYISSTFLELANEIGKRHIIDKSLDVFEIDIEKKDEKWIIKGETLNRNVYSDIEKLSDSLFHNMETTFNFQLLPDSSLRDSLYGIVNVSVTPVKEKPSHASQMIDQIKMGEKVTLLRYYSGWYLSQNQYKYIGWVNKTAIHIYDSTKIKNWSTEKQIRVKSIKDFIYSNQNVNSMPVCDIILNNKLKLLTEHRNWSKVQLPDGRSGYIKNSTYKNNSMTHSSSQIQMETAYQLMGSPYLWGGNSVNGNDCSGFIHNIYENSGINLPRDARQQAELGKLIIPNDNWSNVKPGDLLFFGKENKITHVGMSTGGKEFIHQGGMVRVNSLDSSSNKFAPKRNETFQFIKRLN